MKNTTFSDFVFLALAVTLCSALGLFVMRFATRLFPDDGMLRWTLLGIFGMALAAFWTLAGTPDSTPSRRAVAFMGGLFNVSGALLIAAAEILIAGKQPQAAEALRYGTWTLMLWPGVNLLVVWLWFTLPREVAQRQAERPKPPSRPTGDTAQFAARRAALAPKPATPPEEDPIMERLERIGKDGK